MKLSRPAATFLALLSVFMAVPGCKHLPRPVAEWADCVGHETEWNPLIAEVARALGEKDFNGALLALALRFGWPAIDCAVEAFLTNAEQTLATGRGAPQDHLRAERGREWLTKRGQRR